MYSTNFHFFRKGFTEVKTPMHLFEINSDAVAADVTAQFYTCNDVTQLGSPCLIYFRT